MNILITDSGKYPHIGGKSTHIKNLSKGLCELGHSVKIISSSDVPFFHVFFVVILPSIVLGKIPNIGKRLSFYWAEFAMERLIKMRILRELKYNKYDAVSAQDIIASSICRDIISRLDLNVPIITTVHGDYKNEKLSARNFLKGTSFEKWLVKREVAGYIVSDLIIAVDNRLKEHILEMLSSNGVTNKPQIKVMFNYLDLAEFKPYDLECKDKLKKKWAHQIDIDSYVLLCPRRLTAKNGVIYAALMCKCLKERNPEFKFQLVFAGEGEDKEKIYEIINMHKLGGIIRLLGDVEHKEMRSLYGISDIVIIPSVPSEGVIEATSLSVLEAMACGIPVIASNIGGLAELICNSKTGLLVEPKDTIAIADAVLKLSMDNNLRLEIEKNAIEYVKMNHSHIVAANQFASFCRLVTYQ